MRLSEKRNTLVGVLDKTITARTSAADLNKYAKPHF
jgi:hypothetical protein